MQLVEKTIEGVFKKAIAGLFPSFGDWDKLFIQRTNDSRFGDCQCNFAMAMAKPFGRNPRQLAQEIVGAVGADAAIDRLDIAGPGFINIFLKDSYLSEHVRSIGGSYDFSFLGTGGTVVIDYSSPNIAKRMHIGHLGTTVIGDSIKRMYQFLGYRLTADNHIGDWGTQFGKLIVGYRDWLDRKAYEAGPIAELERLYVKFEKDSERDASLEDRARGELKKLQDGDAENKRIWQEFVDLSLKEYDRLYQRLDIKFDTYYGESYYHGQMPGVVRELKDKGLARTSDDALVVFFDEKENIPPCIVQKKDGAFLYATSDLACIRFRMEKYAPVNRIIYVTDDRQQGHFKQIFRISDLLGWDIKKVHVGYGLMRFPDGVFSTRKGNVILLDDLLNEAARRARAIIEEKNPGLPGAEKESVAEAVGSGAVKYAVLSQNRVSTLIFEWDKVLSFDGNTAPYLQYTHARIQSVLRKAADMSKPLDDRAPVALGEKIERDLAVAMSQFPNVVIKAAENYTPNLIADYLFELAQTFNTLYNSLPILKEKDEVLFSRLLLADRTARVVRMGLGLLGIRALDRM